MTRARLSLTATPGISLRGGEGPSMSSTIQSKTLIPVNHELLKITEVTESRKKFGQQSQINSTQKSQGC